MNALKTILFLTLIIVILASCNRDPQSTGRVFMPDMFYSVAVEPYTPSALFENGMSARKPVEGTIPRGFEAYHYPNTIEGYDLAGEEVKMPAELKNEASLKTGKKLYTIYCAVCHGEKGDGQGSIVQREVFPPPPDYRVRLNQITEGNMYHSVVYGKNMMGSHASQLNPTERWQVIYYIQKLAGVGDFAN